MDSLVITKLLYGLMAIGFVGCLFTPYLYVKTEDNIKAVRNIDTVCQRYKDLKFMCGEEHGK